eukprot:TRINITY_DN17637_c2_g1_i1.p1 TRINITY_DN17637_c2_g1~~TRINITY_DN17637_c2_g1_i1.p1  ORF type:complete len:105 (+),score=9.07 TRINITY_DN17637_c2_g1_i1:602-916(+)
MESNTKPSIQQKREAQVSKSIIHPLHQINYRIKPTHGDNLSTRPSGTRNQSPHLTSAELHASFPIKEKLIQLKVANSFLIEAHFAIPNLSNRMRKPTKKTHTCS